MAERQNLSNPSKTDLLTKINSDFSPIILLLNKAAENYQKISIQNLNEIAKIVLSLENNLQSISVNKINNIKSLLKASDKGLRTYINDTKIALNKILIKSKEISLQYLTLTKSKSSVNDIILESEIKQKELELNNITKELNYYKNKYNSVNQNYQESQKLISELKEENTSYKEKIIENDKNSFIQNYPNNGEDKTDKDLECITSFSEKTKIDDTDKIRKLEKKIKELNNTIDTNRNNFESQISRMTDKNTSLSQILSKKNLEYMELQKENMEKIQENQKLKNSINTNEKELKNLQNKIEKNINREKEYQEKISQYQKQIEENDKIINDNNIKINLLNDNSNKDKLRIKTLESEIEKIKISKNDNQSSANEYINILTDLEKCRKEKEEIESELENTKKLLESNGKEYKKKIEIMESTIVHNNDMINKKDELIKELKANHKTDPVVDKENNTNNEEIEKLNQRLKEQEEVIKAKEEQIKELKELKEVKKDSKENLIYQKMIQYKEDNNANLSLIKVLKEQIRSLESENKTLKEEKGKNNNNNDNMFDMVEKMLKLEKEIDKLQKELEKYKNNKSHLTQNSNMVEVVDMDENINDINKLKSDYEELENKYNEEKEKNTIYEAQITEKIKENNDLKLELDQIRLGTEGNHNNNFQSINGSKNIRYLNNSLTDKSLTEKYNKNLEQLINAKNQIKKLEVEVANLKNQIKKMENKNKIKESLFRCKSIDDENSEEEFDMAQLEEGVKKKNRSEDLNIDFPGNNETKKKYEELEERFNKLKEQVVPLLKSNANPNVTKNKVSKICNLLGTSTNTTNNILDKYNI